MNLTKHILFTLLLLLTGGISAQVVFNVEVNKNKVGANEHFEVFYTIGNDSAKFTAPSFKDFYVVARQSSKKESPSSQGESELFSVESFKLVAKKPGNFFIEEARLSLDKRIYKTKRIEIEVVEDDIYNPDKDETLETKLEKGVHLIVAVSNKKITINDSIIVTYKLYVSPDIGITAWREKSEKTFKDFDFKFIDIGQIQIQNETFNGLNYRSVLLRKVVLRPKKKGQLKVEKLELSLKAEVPMTQTVDFDKNKIYKSVTTDIESQLLTISVN